MRDKLKELYSKLIYYFPTLMKPVEYTYCFLNNIFSSNAKYKNDINEGEKLLKNLTKDKKYYYVLIDKGIGDTIIVASYAYYLEKKYNKKIAFIVYNHHIDVVKKFSYIKKVIGCNKDDFDKISLYIAYSNKYETNSYKYAYFKMNVCKNGVRNWSSADWDKSMIFSDRFRKYVFDLPDDFKKYKVTNNYKKEEINKILKENKINKDSIIIIPYANTVVNLKIDFWEKLVEVLHNKGYKDIYTNIGNPKKEKPINGTTGLNLSLSDLYMISNEFNYFIAIRCGVCEYLALNSPKMVVINDYTKNYNKWDDVNNFSDKKTIKNLYKDNNTDPILIDNIIDILKGEK